MRLPNLAVGGSISWTSPPWTPGLAPAGLGLCEPPPHAETCAGQACVPGGPPCASGCTCLCSIKLFKDEESGLAVFSTTGCTCQGGVH
jgi:hypothetical protein